MKLRLCNEPRIDPVRHALVEGAPAKPAFSELVLSDRLITLAKDADRAGFIDTAEHLLTLACSVFDEAPKKPH
jgi:hypothetical protein